MIILTDSAKNRMCKLLKDVGFKNKCIRFGVKGGGCSGFSYFLEIDEISNKDILDELINLDGIPLIVDGPSIMYVMGTEIDWKEDIMGSCFSFKSPKKASSCGCGTSVNFKV